MGERLALRTKGGWFSRVAFRRRGRDPDSDPGRKATEPLLPRVAGAVTVGVACALRARWRNRHRKKCRAGLRRTTAPPASGGIAGEASVPGDPGVHRVFRPAERREPGSAGRTVPKPPA